MIRILIITLISICFAQQYYSAVDLSTVPALTFYKDHMTTGRRSSPVPQLKCVGGDGCSLFYLVNVVQCKNMGVNEYGDPQWECTANLDKRVKLGRTDVTCEGFMDSNDKMKLAGSCGLEYELFLQPLVSDSYTQTTTTEYEYVQPQPQYRPYASQYVVHASNYPSNFSVAVQYLLAFILMTAFIFSTCS